VGTDITDIAVEWAGKNVQGNPHLAHLIEIRRTGQSSQPLDSTNIEKVGISLAHCSYLGSNLIGLNLRN